MKKRKSGQGILEYILVLTAIIVVIIAAAVAVMQPAANRNMQSAQQVADRGTGLFQQRAAGTLP
jgi:uncharacterized protein (UPF0333 family)